MIEFVSRHCYRDPIFHLICDSKFGPRGGPDPQSLSNRVNAGVTERFESFRLGDLERGSKWLPDESSSQFGRKPQVTKLMIIYQSLALWAVSATEQWIVSVLDEILLPSVKSEHGIGH